MTTGPYDHVFRKLPPKTKTKPPVASTPPIASASDIHREAEAPLVTDVKTLELFAKALTEFSNGQSKTMTQRNRYRTSTLSLSVALTIFVGIVGIREIKIGMGSSDKGNETAGLDWSQIEAKIEARMAKPAVPEPDDRPAKAGEDPTTALLHAQIAVLLRLRIEQDKYAADLLSNPTKRRLPKPESLLDAERAADVMLAGR